METENKQERRVLISVKVSTLFAILISIIILAAVAVAIGNYITVQEMKSKVLSENDIDEIEEETSREETLSSGVQTIQMSERSAVITSRSSERRENISISVVENPEEENVKEEQENLVVVSTPIEEVKISADMDLTVRTGLSKEDFTDNQVNIFFNLIFGSLYERLDFDIEAMKYYYEAKNYSDKLPPVDPDGALVYCFLGELFIKLKEYSWAMRS